MLVEKTTINLKQVLNQDIGFDNIIDETIINLGKGQILRMPKSQTCSVIKKMIQIFDTFKYVGFSLHFDGFFFNYIICFFF